MEKLVKVESVVAQVWDSTQIKILSDEKGTFTRINEKVVFIPPILKEIKPTVTAPFILVSAPGAVGKTTFAKFFAHLKKGYYWDLSKIKLGDNSFIGTLAKCFGPENLSKAIAEINAGNISFFIDAFDEAEIISGWNGVENFMHEIYTYCKNAPRPNVVLFSRSETASMLELVLQEISSENSIYSMFEIDYFDEKNSKEFIKKYLSEDGVTDFEKHTEPFNNAVNSIFKVIGKGIDSEVVDIWNNNDIRSFIGYAPVLQTIASFLKEERNYEEITSHFQEESVVEGVKVISDFIEKLLDREQKKFINGVKEKVGEEYLGWENWDLIYSPDRQIEIVLNYIVNKRTTAQIPMPDYIPDWMRKDYLESLTNFLPNHPFLRGGDYSSPAFRDYSLGKLISDTFNCNLCKTLLSTGKFVLTQLFSIFYSKYNSGKCYGPHVGFLYESVASRLSMDDNMLLTYIKPSDADENPKYSLEILNTTGVGYNNIDLECVIDENNPLVIERRLHHATIDIMGSIILGRSTGSIELSEVSIRANNLILAARELIVNCQDDNSVTIRANNFTQEDYSLSLKVIGSENLKVNFPGANSHPWTKYSFVPSKEEQLLNDELYALKRILEPFRKHGKKEFGKQFEFINNRIVKGSQIREQMLAYLIQLKILKKNLPDKQYYMDEQILNNEGVNWGDLKNLMINSGIKGFLEKFKSEQLQKA